MYPTRYRSLIQIIGRYSFAAMFDTTRPCFCTLALVAGCGLVAHRAARRPELALGPNVVAQDRAAAAVSSPADVAIDHLGVPDAVCEHLVDPSLVGVELVRPAPRPPGRLGAALAGPPHGPGMNRQLAAMPLR